MFTDDLQLEELGDRLTALASDMAAAECQWLLMLAEFDRREGWSGPGLRSCAHWLSWRCGLALGAARERVRIARALPSLPVTVAAFAEGRLSYSKVRALTRVATPENETELVEIALCSTASQVDRIVAGYRTATEEPRKRLYLTWHTEEDGTVVLRGRFAPEEGAAIVAAIERELTRGAGEDVPAGTSDGTAEDIPSGTLEETVGDVPAGTSDGTAGGVPAGTLHETGTDVPAGTFHEHDADVSAETPSVPGRSAREALVALAEASLRETDRLTYGADVYQVVLHVKDGTATIDGQPVSRVTAERLRCDASGFCVHTDPAGAVLDVGRRTRTIPPAIRRALQLRDGGCRFPGCGQRRRVDAHHVRYWSAGGETSLENLCLLCGFHHTLIHEGQFGLVMRRGQPVFTTADGTPIPEVPRAPRSGESLTGWHAGRVQPDAIVPGWYGDPLDLGYTVASLLARQSA